MASKLLVDSLGDELLHLDLDDGENGFVVHKKLLLECSDLFRKGFAEPFRMRNKYGIAVREVSNEGAKLFIDWLYRRQLPSGVSKDDLEVFFDLYYFAEKLGLHQLADLLMDRIQDLSRQLGVLVTPARVSECFKYTARHSRLREYSTRALCYANHGDKLKQMRQDRARGSSNKDDVFDTFPSAWKVLYEMSEDDSDIFCSYFEAFETTKDKDLDPRKRDDNDEVSRCYFHCHKDAKDCPRKRQNA